MEREKKGGTRSFFRRRYFFLCVLLLCSPLNIYPKKSKGDFSIGMKKWKAFFLDGIKTARMWRGKFP